MNDRVAGSAVVERLTALHPKLIDLSTERIERLLHALGDPHLALPRVIHVAGTNGKGSTVAFLRAGLEAAGLRVNVYTSPHLVRFTERVRLAGREITEDELLAVLERCEQANARQAITFFEILTAAAFLAFAETPADATVVEVGLGGRYDATNVFPAPAMSAIASVSVDHVEFLGADLARIAWEKAGVLKPGRPAVVAPQTEAAATAIREVAKETGAHVAWG
ncbi:MAG: Mur ligase family protein, partial [Alphaproteobacteria bacterium]